MKSQTFWDRLRRAVQDRSFIVGSLLVAIFLLVAVLGPEIAPHNPYLRDRVQTIGGELYRAPIPPCDLYPLGTDSEGRDMLSMLLHGARQTLVIAFVAMTVRLLLGLLLGTLAGWWPDSTFDRVVTALIEFLAAVPGLALAVLLVFAVGIRRGQVSFVVALSLVGWGEVTQIIRSSVLVIRNKLYILAARALGLSSAQVLSRHVLPNLLSTLLALAALEMGGVLLLLGELGFVHVFVGGGGVYEDDAIGVIHFFDIPDWGAMLGTSWRYFRARPWLPMAPALAFFAAVLGFNLFGYGLQRFIEKGRFHPSGWSLLSFFLVVALILLGARALLVATGIEAQYTDLARQFDGHRASADVAHLIRSESEIELGQGSISSGERVYAADYIAGRFEQAGLTPLPKEGYFQPYIATRGWVTAEPALQILGMDGELRMRLDKGISFDSLQPFDSEGADCGRACVEDELVVLGNVEGGVRAEGVILLLDPTEVLRGAWYNDATPYVAILRLVPDAELWRNDLAPSSAVSSYMSSIPELLIGESAARQLLAEARLDLNELRRSLEARRRINVSTGLRVRVQAGLAYEEEPAVNVVGYLPAADRSTEGERILIIAPYDELYPSQLAPRREGGQSQGVNDLGVSDSASSVAIVLEVARLWQDLGFEPKRTVVFAVFDEGGGSYFVQHPIFPAKVSDTWTAVILQGVGVGQPWLARREAGAGLARAFDQSARRFGVRTEELGKWRFFFTGGSERLGYVASDLSYSGLVVVRPDGDLSDAPGSPRSSAGSQGNLDWDLLTQTGQAVAHYLMVLSSR